MLKTRFASLTIFLLDMRNAGYQLNGQRYSFFWFLLKLSLCLIFRRTSKVSSGFQGERGRPPRGDGKATSNLKPTKTLFVINFDPIRTKEHDIEKHFEPYGKVINVRIRRNFSFVQFETQEDATKALEATQRRYETTLLPVTFSAKYLIYLPH